MSKTHPYKQYEDGPVWRVLEKGIKALVKNGDLKETTARSHVVGYLAQLLHEAGVSGANGSLKPRRVIRISRDEEVIVRTDVA